MEARSVVRTPTHAAAKPDSASLLLALVGQGLALAICIVAAGHGLEQLWRSNEFYGHAYAIPVVVAYLVYERRRDIMAVLERPEPPFLGCLAAGAAAALVAIAVMGDAGFVAGIGIPILLGATSFALAGVRLLRLLLLPLVFLTLMVPPPAFIVDGLLVRLKGFVTAAAVTLLQAGGQTVVAEGGSIVLPAGSLFVADACSGLTSIVTMLPIACIVAYFMSFGAWRRIAIVASVVPLAMAANVVRVTTTAMVASRMGIEAAQGSLHDGFGLAIYAGGTLAVIGVARLVR